MTSPATEWRKANPGKVRLYRERNRGRLAIALASWRKAHPTYDASLRKRHPERTRLYSQRYRLANPEQARMAAEDWKARNREKYRSYTRRRRMRDHNVAGSHTNIEWLLLKFCYDLTCPMCGRREPRIQLTEDHMTPISLGGANFISNIQPLCYSCNLKKGTKAYCVIPLAA